MVATAGDATSAPRDHVPPARPAVPVERVESTAAGPIDPDDPDDLDKLSAELVEAILSADDPDVALPARDNAEAGLDPDVDVDAHFVADHDEVAGEDETRNPVTALRARA
jgi:hypothetical protein